MNQKNQKNQKNQETHYPVTVDEIKVFISPQVSTVIPADSLNWFLIESSRTVSQDYACTIMIIENGYPKDYDGCLRVYYSHVPAYQQYMIFLLLDGEYIDISQEYSFTVGIFLDLFKTDLIITASPKE